MPIYKVSQWFYIFAGIIRKVFAMYLLWMAFVSGDFSLILTDFRGGAYIKKNITIQRPLAGRFSLFRSIIKY